MSSAHPSDRSPSSDQTLVADEALQQEMIRSERKRVLMLMGLIVFMLGIVIVTRAFPDVLSENLRPKMKVMMPRIATLAVGYLLYEFAVYLWLGRLLKLKGTLSTVFQYVNVFIEVSLPTAAMLVGSRVFDRSEVILGIPPLLYFALISLTALNLNARLCVFAGFIAGAEFLAVSFHLLGQQVPDAAQRLTTSTHQLTIKALVMFAAGLTSGFVAKQIRQQLTRALDAMGQRERAVSIFGQHVSPQVAGLLLNQPREFTGENRNVCVMFLDIRDFSRFAGEKSAPEVMAYLNTLFGSMIPVINKHQGIVNKFLGDGFMAVFGAPLDDDEHCRHAIDASQEILHRLGELNAEGTIPPTRIGIGLHTGTAMTGNVGTKERKEYTIIGDSVNLAARIEQATKPLKAQLLISESVVETLHGGDGLAMEDMGPVELKGQAKPVRLFKLA
jgi:adenylate cyclase